MGIENLVHRAPEQWLVLVDVEDQPMAHWQLTAYWTENIPSPIKPTPAYVADSGWWGVLGYLAVIWAVPVWQSMTSTNLTRLGRLDAGLVQTGEFWRTMTALTLHTDISHILSNSFFGAIFGLFVGRYLGSGYGWLLVLISATLANTLNAWLQPAGFLAIGASTATFAALGIVPAFAWRRGYFKGQGFKRGFAPIFGAIALFSFTGFGTDNVDVLGHLFGFSAGLLMGLLVANVDIPAKSMGDQQRAGLFTVVLVAIAWWAAF